MGTETDLILTRLIDHHGTLFSEELGIDLAGNTPSALFRWLCAALLMSARIPHRTAARAALALADAGWTTAERLAASAWEDRVAVLDRAGYGRYDETTARMLGETAAMVLDRYGGDLRGLRDAARDDPPAQRERLKAFKGIGDTGADIFLREMQTVWDEHFPFLDDTARAAAHRLGLPDAAAELADLTGRVAYSRLVAALVRVKLDGVGREDLLAETNGAQT